MFVNTSAGDYETFETAKNVIMALQTLHFLLDGVLELTRGTYKLLTSVSSRKSNFQGIST